MRYKWPALILALLLLSACRSAGPEASPQARPPLKIYLDAGHGGHDPGALSPEGRQEKDDVLRLALAVRDALANAGAEVVLTRETDVFVELIDRCTLANDGGATLFISLHRNSGGASGVEIWINLEPAEEAVRLAEGILTELEEAGIAKNRGVKRGTAANDGTDYAPNNGTVMPSCLIELGFMDSAEDNALFDAHFDAYAEAIAAGILAMR